MSCITYKVFSSFIVAFTIKNSTIITFKSRMFAQRLYILLLICRSQMYVLANLNFLVIGKVFFLSTIIPVWRIFKAKSSSTSVYCSTPRLGIIYHLTTMICFSVISPTSSTFTIIYCINIRTVTMITITTTSSITINWCNISAICTSNTVIFSSWI